LREHFSLIDNWDLKEAVNRREYLEGNASSNPKRRLANRT
jgi:hypothetical protein